MLYITQTNVINKQDYNIFYLQFLETETLNYNYFLSYAPKKTTIYKQQQQKWFS